MTDSPDTGLDDDGGAAVTGKSVCAEYIERAYWCNEGAPLESSFGVPYYWRLFAGIYNSLWATDRKRRSA